MARISGMERTLLLLVLFLFLGAPAHGAQSHVSRREAKDHHNWNYEDRTGPTHWPDMFKRCGGSRQSPIDIDPDEVDKNDDLDDFDFDNYEDPMRDARIENNGHTVVVTPGAADSIRTVTKGDLDDVYRFVQLHFHWGANSKRGSEHTIDGQTFPLEMHLVHMNTNYKTKEAALQKEDGLAVLGVLFKISDEDNPALEPIIDKLDDVRKENSRADLDDITLSELLPDDLMPYYRYEGSLTTPPCSEAVVWTVFKNYATVSEKQMQQFRNVKEEDAGEPEESLVDNFRPPQPLHGRIVEVSDEEDEDDDEKKKGPGDAAAALGAPASLLPLLAAALLFARRR